MHTVSRQKQASPRTRERTRQLRNRAANETPRFLFHARHSKDALLSGWTPSIREAVLRAYFLECEISEPKAGAIYVAVVDTKESSSVYFSMAIDSSTGYHLHGYPGEISSTEVAISEIRGCLGEQCVTILGAFSLKSPLVLPDVDAAALMALRIGRLFGGACTLPVAAMMLACLRIQGSFYSWVDDKEMKNGIVSRLSESGLFDIPLEWKTDWALMTDTLDSPKFPDAVQGRMLIQSLVENRYGRTEDDMPMTTVKPGDASAVKPQTQIPEPHDGLRQALSRLSPHHLINILQHSSHNTEAFYRRGLEAWDVQLPYPSGYAERFRLLRNPKYVQGVKKVQLLDPFEDLIHTVDVLLRNAGHSNLIEHIRFRLTNAWQGKFPTKSLFQAALNTVGELITEKPLRSYQLPEALAHTFFDQLYDRSVLPFIGGTKGAMEDNVYGEIKPPLLSKIFKELGLSRDATYLDLGSGVGNTVMQAALEYGCEAHGMERANQPHLVGALHLQQFHARAVLWGLHSGQVNLHFGDFLHSQLVDTLLSEVDAVFINNLKYGPETDEKLYQKLARRLKIGVKIFSMKALKPNGRRVADPCFDSVRHRYEEGSVSWTGSGGEYCISTKRKHMA